MASRGTIFSLRLTQRHYKKYVLILCVLTWAAIFFISGTLFVTRRYNASNQMVPNLHSTFQDQIHLLRSEISDGATSVKFLMQVLHQRTNETLSRIDQKISILDETRTKRQHTAFQVPRSSGSERDQEKPFAPTITPTKLEIQLATSRSRFEIKSSANGMCVDTMDQLVGSYLELYECHGQEGNQAWKYREGTHVIENKDKNMCLTALNSSDGSPVKTAICDANDTQQKWIRKEFSYQLENEAEAKKCLDFEPENKRVVMRDCDSKKASQRWTH